MAAAKQILEPTTSPAAKVFTTVELLANIFNYTAIQDLLQLQRINKTCRNTLTTYRKYQEVLGFRATHRKITSLTTDDKRQAKRQNFFFAPQALPSISTLKYLQLFSREYVQVNPMLLLLSIQRTDADCATNMIFCLVYNSITPAALYASPSFNQMLLTQPPCAEVSFHLTLPSELTQFPPIQCTSSTGVTIGDFLKHVQDMMDEEHDRLTGPVYIKDLRIHEILGGSD